MKGGIMKVLLVIIYLTLTLCGMVFIKLGGNPGTLLIKNSNITISMNTISAIGFITYILSFLLFTKIIIIFDMSYIAPLCTGIIQIAVLIVSYYIFKENISVYGIIGVAFIIIGIIIMNLQPNNNHFKTNMVNMQETIQDVNTRV